MNKVCFWAIAALSVGACDKIPGSLEYEAHKGASALLKDPSSARFRNDSVNGSGAAVCGEIDGKNGFGAYNGFSKYVYVQSIGTRISRGEPDFEEYFRDTENYNEYTFKDSYQKVQDACDFNEAWINFCPKDKVEGVVNYKEKCALFSNSGISGQDKLKKMIRGY